MVTQDEYEESLRDLFAALAMLGAVASAQSIDKAQCASWAYRMADAMLAERDKE
jgi:hypothetical protein